MKSKNSNEFATSSIDGSITWWEIEKDVLIRVKRVVLPVKINVQIEKPLFLTNTEKIKENGEEREVTKEYGGTRIDNSTDTGASKFLLGTEQGVLFIVNKKNRRRNWSKIRTSSWKASRPYCRYAKKSILFQIYINCR